MEERITNSEIETQKLGKEFAGKINKGDILCLYGDLGSGKTTFTKGFAVGLEINERIISPTFVIVREHDARQDIHFYHIDLYRLENEKELEGIGIEDILFNENAVVLIEWAERLGRFLPKKRWDIRFEQLEKNKHKITIKRNE